MARTISATALDPNRPDDLDGQIVDGIEALRQRIVRAIRFRFGTWFLARQRGLDYDRIIGHQITDELAAGALNGVIREEGGDEVTGLSDLRFSLARTERVFSYHVVVGTIYGPMTLSETING